MRGLYVRARVCVCVCVPARFEQLYVQCPEPSAEEQVMTVAAICSTGGETPAAFVPLLRPLVEAFGMVRDAAVARFRKVGVGTRAGGGPER